MKGLLRILTMCLSMAWVGWSPAAEPLTSAKVGAWIDAMEFPERWDRENGARLESLGNMPDEDSDTRTLPFERTAAEIQAQGLANENNAVLVKHGFADLSDWAITEDRVIRAMFSLGLNSGDYERTIRKQLAMIQNDPDLAPARQRQMTTAIEENLTMIEHDSNASEADQAAVQPHLERLQTLGE